MDNSTSGCRPFYLAAPSYPFVEDAGYLIGDRLQVVFLRLVHGISRRAMG
jgi:hypothetical protein